MSWEQGLAELRPQKLAYLALKVPPEAWKMHSSSLLYENGGGAEVNLTQPCWCGRRGCGWSGKEGLERARAVEGNCWALAHRETGSPDRPGYHASPPSPCAPLEAR